MDFKARINFIRQYIQNKWFNIALIVLAGMLILNKDLSIRFNIKAPLDKEKSTMPGVNSPITPQKKNKSKTKVTEILGSQVSKAKSQGSLADPFNAFAPSSIPETPENVDEKPDYEISQVTQAQVESFVKRFGDVAKNEMQKFKVPASIILAHSLLSSHAGVSQVTKTSNNFFALPCTSNWEGPTIEFNEICYRKYETAWFSFRDHTKFITTGNFRHLTNLSPSDYVRWAKGLELAGYNKTSGYSTMIIKTIEEFGLDRFD